MDDIGVKAKELYNDNINELVRFVRFCSGKEDEELEEKCIEDYDRAVQQFVDLMLVAFPEEKLTEEFTNYWLTHGVNLTFEKLYDEHADKIFLKRDMSINGKIYINKNTDSKATNFTVKEGKIVNVENLNDFIMRYARQFRTRHQLKMTERRFIGRHIEAVYDELEALRVIEDDSELKYTISMCRQQKEIARSFHTSVIYSLLMQGCGNYDARRALLFDKFVNLGFDFEKIYSRNYILAVKYPHKEFTND